MFLSSISFVHYLTLYTSKSEWEVNKQKQNCAHAQAHKPTEGVTQRSTDRQIYTASENA